MAGTVSGNIKMNIADPLTQSGWKDMQANYCNILLGYLHIFSFYFCNNFDYLIKQYMQTEQISKITKGHRVDGKSVSYFCPLPSFLSQR